MGHVGITSTVVTVNVRAGSSVLDQVVALLRPVYDVHAPVSKAEVDIDVVRRRQMSVDMMTKADIWRLPQLSMGPDSARYVVVYRDATKTVVIRDRESDAANVLVSADSRKGQIEIEIYDESRRTIHAVARMISYAVGGLTNDIGFPAYHASAVAMDGMGVIIAGESGAGKSTLAFLVCSRAGWDFIADDQVYVWNERPGSPPRLAGWPKRLGIGVSALEGHSMRHVFESTPLRWHDGPTGPLEVPAGPWNRVNRSRIYCDIDEFFAMTGVSGTHTAALCGVVLPEARRDFSGWQIEPAGIDNGARWHESDDALATVRQRKHAIDFLGLLPRRPADPARRAGLEACVAATPAVRVRYGPDINQNMPRFWAEVMKWLASVNASQADGQGG